SALANLWAASKAARSPGVGSAAEGGDAGGSGGAGTRRPSSFTAIPGGRTSVQLTRSIGSSGAGAGRVILSPGIGQGPVLERSSSTRTRPASPPIGTSTRSGDGLEATAGWPSLLTA